MALPFALLLSAFAALTVHAQNLDAHEDKLATGGLVGYEEYKTEPNFRAPIINITYQHPDHSLLQPGYYFYAPFATGQPAAPCIFDQRGQVVWWGQEEINHQVKDFQVCDYLGQQGQHLCWAEFSFSTLSQERSKGRIFDNTYQAVGREYSDSGDFGDPNPHEFNMLPGGRTFLQAVYQEKRMDQRPYAGRQEGYIVDGCFQEVDVATGRPVFQWCALDHIKIDDTLLYLNVKENKENYTEPIAGTGQAIVPWDWFHFNAVDKNEEGDYIISSRHLSQIIKIAGKDNNLGRRPGSILWRLNNKGNQFKMIGDWSFSRQHHVRYVNTTATETTFALFNNGWEIRNKAGFANHSSSGQVITINNETMEARLTQEYLHPDKELSIAAGSMFVTENRNAIVGWGTLPQLSEYHEDGTLLFHMEFTPPKAAALNYRAFKFPWVGKPQQLPKLLAYSKTCTSHRGDSPLMAYVSWNGATEVVSWRFHISTASDTGPWLPAGTFEKTGFETAANLTSSLYGGFASFAPYVSVQGLDANGKVLASTVVETFVPNSAYEAQCDATGCNRQQYFKYKQEWSCGGTCGTSLKPAIVILVLVVLAYEAAIYFSQKWWSRIVRIGDVGQRIMDGDVEGRLWAGNEKRPWSVKRARSGYEKPGKGSALLKASGTARYD